MAIDCAITMTCTKRYVEGIINMQRNVLKRNYLKEVCIFVLLHRFLNLMLTLKMASQKNKAENCQIATLPHISGLPHSLEFPTRDFFQPAAPKKRPKKHLSQPRQDFTKRQTKFRIIFVRGVQIGQLRSRQLSKSLSFSPQVDGDDLFADRKFVNFDLIC